MEIRNVQAGQFDNSKIGSKKKSGTKGINTRDSFQKMGSGTADPGAQLKNLSSVLKNSQVKEKKRIQFSVPISDVEMDKARYFPAPEPVVGYDGTIYTTTMEGKLKAFDSEGNEKWEFQNDGSTHITPSVGIDGTVAFYSGNYKKMIALNPDGSKKFETTLPGSPYRDPEVDDKGNIYFRTEKQLNKINNKGELEWSRKIVKGAGFLMTPEGKILVPYKGEIACIDESQKMLWTYNPKGPIDASPAFGSNGKMMMVEKGHFKILDKDGKISADTKIENEARGDVLVDDKDNSYFGGKTLHAMDPDGKKLWEYDAGGYINRAPAITQDGTVIAATQQDIFAIKDGKLLWKTPVDDPDVQEIFVSPDGTVYKYNDGGQKNLEIFGKDGKKLGDYRSPNGSFKIGGFHKDGYLAVCDHRELHALKERSTKEVAADLAKEVKKEEQGNEDPAKIETQGDWVIIGGVKIKRRRKSGF